MTTPERSFSLARWLLPAVISLLTLALALQQRESIPFFSLLNWELLLLVGMMGAWALLAWGIALNERRTVRLHASLPQHIPWVPIGLLVGVLFLLDYCTSLLDALGEVFLQHFIAFGVIAIVSSMLIMLTLSSESPRTVWQKLTLSLFSVVVGLIVIELIFRHVLVDSHIPRNQREFDAQIASSWPRPIAVSKPDGTFRIVGVADSFGTLGRQQNYHYVLEAILQKQYPQVEVVNLSVGAYELPDELELFTRFGPRYAPDLVLHGFFVGNDFWVPDGLPFSYRGITLRIPRGLAGWRPQHFLLRNWFKNGFTVLLDAAQKKNQPPQKEPIGGLAHVNFLKLERQRIVISQKNIPPDDPIWGQVTEQLDRIVAAVQATGAQYVMVIHPDQFQVELPVLEELGQRYNLQPSDYDLLQPQRFLLNYCRERSLPCLDLMPEFRAQGYQGGLYLLDDSHYNDQGNQLAAQEIARFLEENTLIPANPLNHHE